MSEPGNGGIVIVGAGHAGGRAAQALRAAGWRGALTLVGEDPLPPYERPPLSKGLLIGDKAAGDCALQAASFYAAESIELRTGSRVEAIDRRGRRVILADGTSLAYERLLLAPGATPRLPAVPGVDLKGVHTLRSLGDAGRLHAALKPGATLAVIGGGFIGLEVAASARRRGCRVVVIELAPRLMTRSVPAEIAERVAARHRAAGVDLRLASRVAAFVGHHRLDGVRLATGEEIACTAALIGIGVEPRVELAAQAGLGVGDGITVDERLRTTDATVFAVGDAASFPHPLFGRRIRLESWRNAEDQPRVAATNMLGGSTVYDPVPWFWSDQYELTLQIAGLVELGRETVRRDLDANAALFFHLDDRGRLVAASGIGPGTAIGRHVRLAQMLIQRHAAPDPDRLRDPSINLKSLLR